MKHVNELGDPNYDIGAFIKEGGKIKLYGGGGKSAPQVAAPPPPPVTPPPTKEFTPVMPEDTSMETAGKTGTKSLRINTADTAKGSGLSGAGKTFEQGLAETKGALNITK